MPEYMNDYPVRSLLTELEALSREAESERFSAPRSARIEQPLERLGRGHFLSLAKTLVVFVLSASVMAERLRLTPRSAVSGTT